ncbi:MAG: hypothetical protein E5W00_04640 [Mesorhizobium sp.]|nr:MAG: hypothetical protein E5W00_04640 [Mesorhizobium sp.]
MSFYNPPKEIVGKFSGNPPMPWTVHADPVKGTFSISGSSPVPVTTPEYRRQVEITGRLGGKVLAAFPRIDDDDDERTINTIEDLGYEPNIVPLDAAAYADLLRQIQLHDMQDDRQTPGNGLLVASPFGFTSLAASAALENLLPSRMIEVLFE